MHQAEANEKKVKGLEYRYHLTPIFYLLYRSTPMFMIAASKPWVKEAY
jgi:hypothetical protein